LDSRTAAETLVCRFLEENWKYIPQNPRSGEKFFQKSENFICICGKMGYNKME